MRFTPYPKPRGPRPFTRQRLAHAHRAIDRVKAKYPLFGEQFVTETAQDRLARQDREADIATRYWRDCQAALWRRARSLLFAMPELRRRELIDEWNGNKWLPGQPEYLLDFLRARGIF